MIFSHYPPAPFLSMWMFQISVPPRKIQSWFGVIRVIFCNEEQKKWWEKCTSTGFNESKWFKYLAANHSNKKNFCMKNCVSLQSITWEPLGYPLTSSNVLIPNPSPKKTHLWSQIYAGNAIGPGPSVGVKRQAGKPLWTPKCTTIPLFTRFYKSHVVQDFFHQPYH